MWTFWFPKMLTWWAAPTGRTLQERYPARPGAFTTHYSSVELTEEAFVKKPRGRNWRPEDNQTKITW